MGSKLRNFRDTRYSLRSYRDHRAEQQGGPLQRLYDTPLTLKSSNTDLPAFHGHYSRTDTRVLAAHEISRDQLIPAIRTMSANAVTVDKREFFYYPRKRTGRRCTCFAFESSPDAKCPICLGTGIVAGYEKYGCITEIIDFTHPKLVLINVEPTISEDTRPLYFKLADGATSGYIFATVPIKQNIGLIDTILVSQPVFNAGTKVYAIDPHGFERQIIRKEDLEGFLAYNFIKFRIELSTGNERPYLSHFLFRYQTRAELKVIADQTKSQEEFMNFSSIGNIGMYQEIQLFFDALTLKNLENEDLLYRLEDGRRFKVVQVTRNVVTGLLTSTDSTARYLIPHTDLGGFNLLI